MITRLVDSHVHFWQPERLRYDWLSDLPDLNRPFTPADLTAESAGIPLERIVFVQADCVAEDALQEVAWVNALASDDPRIQGIVAFAPLERPSAEAHLEALRANPLVKGVRRLIQSESVDFAAAPGFVYGVRMLADYGFSFDICIKHPQLPSVITLVEACPDVHFALDHIGKPGIKDHLLEPWAADIAKLARYPNVSCKLSGMVTEADLAAWTPADLQPYIDTVLAAFGPDRLMFGGDWPVVRLASSYARWLTTLDSALTPLSATDRDKIFYTNAHAFYHLPTSPP